jgi:hypothetical protein
VPQGHHPQGRPQRVHPHLLRIPQVIRGDCHHQSSPQGDTIAQQPAGDGIAERDEQRPENQGEERQGELSVAGTTRPQVKKQVVAGGMNVANCVRDQSGDVQGRQVGTYSLIIPQTLLPQTVQTQQKTANHDEKTGDSMLPGPSVHDLSIVHHLPHPDESRRLGVGVRFPGNRTPISRF